MSTASSPAPRSAGALPVLVGFRHELGPALAAIWALAAILFVASRWPAWLVFALWGSVTTIMLWPVGHQLGIPYRAYRRPLFILGVLSMAALPALGIALELLPSNAKEAPYLPRLAALVATVLIMFLVGGLPKAEPHLPAPNGSWWGLLFAIGLGLIQIIPLRGMLKLRMRLARVSAGRWRSWPAVAIREIYLALAALAVLYGFHNVFKGTVPLFDMTLEGLEDHHFADAGLPGLVSLALAGLFLVVVRGGYKRRIGDPFIRETRGQSAVKQLLFLVGIIWLLYSFAIVMEGRPFLRAPLINTEPAPLVLGLSLFGWGLLLVGPIRYWAQRNQRLALIGQMATVLLPAMPAERRKAVMLQVMEGLSRCSAPDRVAYVSAMLDSLAAAPEDIRTLMAALRFECLAELPAETRRRLMTAMDLATVGGRA